MPVIRNYAPQIAAATRQSKLGVIPFSRSTGNLTFALQGQDSNFFAKIFAFDKKRGLSANERYVREKAVLSCPWNVRIPVLVLSLDIPRLLVTREVLGHGFQLFIDEGRVLDGLTQAARWIAGFHSSAQKVSRNGTLWDEYQNSSEFASIQGFVACRELLENYAVEELVFSKGDCSVANFKFTMDGVVGLDFEGAGLRPKEYDLISLLEGLAPKLRLNRMRMTEVVVEAYHSVRPLSDPEATKRVVARLLALRDRRISARLVLDM